MTTVAGDLVVADPMLVAGLQQAAQGPAAAEPPELLHFSPTELTRERPALPRIALGTRFGAGGFGPIQPGPGVLLLLAGVLAGVVALTTKSRWHRINARFIAVPPAVWIPMVMPLIVAAAVLMSLVRATRLPATASLPSPSHGAAHTHDVAPTTTVGSSSWSTLVAIETSITQQHDRLVAADEHIADVNTTLAGMPGPSHPPLALKSRSPGALTPTGTTLIDQHGQLASEYDRTLQKEYEFFSSVAQQPAELATLRAAAAQAPRDVQTAVTYDITVVQTQQTQAAAIQAALINPARPAPLPTGRVAFHAPVGGVVTQGFGPTDVALEPPLTYKSVFSAHFHTGLDIAAPLDAPVGAAANGIVVLATSSRDAAGNLVGYGNYIVIQHADGYETLYGHLDQVLVTVGEKVRRGQVIGLLGSSGWSTGPHLHFEIRDNGVYVDPAPFLAAQLRP